MEHLVCHECYIRVNVAPECILPLRDQKRVISNNKTLSPVEKWLYQLPFTFKLNSCSVPQKGPVGWVFGRFPLIPVRRTKDERKWIRVGPSSSAPFAVSSDSRPLGSWQGRLRHQGRTCVTVARDEGIKIVRMICLFLLQPGATYKIYAGIGSNCNFMHRLVTCSTQRSGPISSVRTSFQPSSKPKCPQD